MLKGLPLQLLLTSSSISCRNNNTIPRDKSFDPRQPNGALPSDLFVRVSFLSWVSRFPRSPEKKRKQKQQLIHEGLSSLDKNQGFGLPGTSGLGILQSRFALQKWLRPPPQQKAPPPPNKNTKIKTPPQKKKKQGLQHGIQQGPYDSQMPRLSGSITAKDGFCETRAQSWLSSRELVFCVCAFLVVSQGSLAKSAQRTTRCPSSAL